MLRKKGVGFESGFIAPPTSPPFPASNLEAAMTTYVSPPSPSTSMHGKTNMRRLARA